MKVLRGILDKQGRFFHKGGPLERFHALYEAGDTFLYTPGEVTHAASHVRDGLDLKRMMFTVVLALGPCMFWAMYNTGYQAALAVQGGALPLEVWQAKLFESIGFVYDTRNPIGCVLFGALFYLPMYIVTIAVGGTIEAIFAIVRGHEITEGFLVTSALFPLTLAPTVPLWQVALGIAFGVTFAKEIFGGVGMNIFNPALMSRAFLFFAYPAQISGDKVWIAAQTSPDGYSGATLLARASEGGMEAVYASGFTWWEAFFGLIPGSMGEGSKLFILFGAAVLIVTQVGSWRTMAGALAGSFVMILVFNAIEPETKQIAGMPFYWHWVLGGFAFGIVFMATDPVSSAFTNTGKFIYGTAIGMLGILIRVINPAYPEGWMLSILFMNMFAPLIDHYIVAANIRRRQARYAAQ